MEEILSLVIVILILIIVINFSGTEGFLVSKKSAFDNKNYKVYGGVDDYAEASVIMSKLNKFGNDLIDEMEKSFLKEKNKTKRDLELGKKLTFNLLSRYNYESLQETVPGNGETSFSFKKGKVISLCLRKPSNMKTHDLEILKFVFLHELAHVATRDYIGHSEPFWKNFAFLLKFAEERGLIKPEDYRKTPQKYCGLTVDYNPFYDEKYYYL